MTDSVSHSPLLSSTGSFSKTRSCRLQLSSPCTWLWNMKRPMTLTTKPAMPTISSRMGLSISSTVTRRFKDSTRMEKQRARRNTALTSAPRISARTHPYVFFRDGHRAICYYDKLSINCQSSRGDPVQLTGWCNPINNQWLQLITSDCTRLFFFKLVRHLKMAKKWFMETGQTATVASQIHCCLYY